MARKGISNKTRFEVFKRDSFTCQYCGKKAPDVILHLDHIQPVSKGGKNTLLNYVTSCVECNSGKSNNLLSDQTVVEKQRQQLSDLQERREQIEMMLKWHNGMNDLKVVQSDKIIEYFNKALKHNISLTQTGEKEMSARIRKYGFAQIISAIDIIAEKYSTLDAEAQLKKLGGVLHFMNASEVERNIMYIKGICKNRFSYFVPGTADSLLANAFNAGYDFDYLKLVAINARNWTDWKEEMEGLIH